MDVDLERARKLGAELGAPATADAAEAFRGADAAIVAVPTSAHFELVRAALDAGLDVLVEKPMTATLAEAEAILELAIRRGRILQVGHLEWFNPALREMRGKIAEPRFIEAHRMGPFPERGTDVDVVRDLMIHDLDILQQILGEEPDRIESIGVPVVTDKVDIANARIAFPVGLHREPHGEPGLADGGPQDPLLPARRLRLDRLPRARGRDLPPAPGRAREGRRTSRPSSSSSTPGTPCSRSSRISCRPCAPARRRRCRAARACARCAPRCAWWKPCPASAILIDGDAGRGPRRPRRSGPCERSTTAWRLSRRWRSRRWRPARWRCVPPGAWVCANGSARFPGFRRAPSGSTARASARSWRRRRLVDRLQKGGHAVFTSTVTLAGREVMRRARPDVPCHLAPLDHPWCVESALSRVRPAALVLIETELWPSWLAAAERRGIPVALVSGRVSDHSYPRYQRLQRIIAPALRRIAALGARTDADAERFLALGAPPARVSVTGDLKLEPADDARPLAPDLGRVLGGAPLIVAGSTHPGEELAALAALAQRRAGGDDGRARAGSAPSRARRRDRPDRAREREDRCAGARCSARRRCGRARSCCSTAWASSRPSTRARRSPSSAGRCVPVGGHNLLEPVFAGRPVLFGPHTENARQAVEILEAVGAGIRVADADELARALVALLARSARGAAARRGGAARAVGAPRQRGARGRADRDAARAGAAGDA